MTLPPHVWGDDDVHRRAIHEAFTKWFLAYDQHCLRQASSYQVLLRHLTTEAEARRLVTVLAQSMALT